MSSNHSPKARAGRVCLVISTLALPGGAERVAVTLADAWFRAGRPVTIVTTDSSAAPPFFRVPPGVDVRNLAIQANSVHLLEAIVRNIHRIFSIRRAVREVSPAVVISFVDVLNVSVIFACVGTGVPVIAAERTSPANAPIGRIWTFLRDVAYRIADRVVVQTSGAYAYLHGLVGRRLTIIPNPVPELRVERQNRNGSCVIAIGRLGQEKGFDLLIRSFAVLAERYPGWRLTIFGDGPLRSDLESLVMSEGLAGRVSLPGTTTDVANVLADADIFVLSSHFEGFPNALCEAMAAGVACIATDCPDGPHEIVHDGIDGVLIPPGDRDALARALGQLMNSPGERERLGGNAKQSVARFSTDHVVRQWNEVIESVTGRMAKHVPENSGRGAET